MKFKWLSFLSEDEKQLQAYESWKVSWTSFYLSFTGYEHKTTQFEVFTSEEDAKTFIASLKEARKLLKDGELVYTLSKN